MASDCPFYHFERMPLPDTFLNVGSTRIENGHTVISARERELFNELFS